MTLTGKVVVVTGAARGMGRAYVEGFIEKGASIVALDRSWVPTGVSGDRDDAFSRSLDNRDDVLKMDCDISDDEQIQDAYEQTMKRFGTIDVLINNASLRQIDLFPPTGVVGILGTTHKDFVTMFDVSFFGTLKMTRVFMQPMLEQRSGSIIMVSSHGGAEQEVAEGVLAMRNPRFEQPYQAAKSALTCFSGYLAYEISPRYNVAVNVIFPASAHTTGYEERAVARAVGEGKSPDQAHVAGGARPEHVVPLALYLAEQDGSGETGHLFETLRWNAAHGFGTPESWQVT